MKNPNGTVLDPLFQQRMQAVACHDIGRATEYIRSAVSHVDEFVKPDPPFSVIEEEVDVGVALHIAAHCRTEYKKTIDTKPPQLGLVFPQAVDRFATVHELP